MKFFLLNIVFLLSFMANAQHSITITVYDKENNEILSGASVTKDKGLQIQSTNSNGKTTILQVEEGDLVQVSFIGYESKWEIIPAAKNLKVYLSRTTHLLNDVIVSNEHIRQNINTISRVDLNKRPFQSSQDILRIVPGLFIAQHQGGGKAEQIFLRGFDIDHGTDIQISVDGLPVNMVSHAHGQGYADLHFVIPETVKNIDYGKGPYYATHGNLANAGYVQFETMDHITQHSFKSEVGRFNTFRNVMLLNLSPKKMDNKSGGYIAAEHLYSDGPFISKQAFNRGNLFGKYFLQLNENNKLSLQASLFGSRWNASGQIPERAIKNNLIDRFGFIDDTEGGRTSRGHLAATLSTRLKNAMLENKFYAIRYNFDLLSNFTYFLRDSINGDRILQKENRNIYGYQNQLVFENRIPGARFKTTIGSGARLDAVKNSRLDHIADRKNLLSTAQQGDINELNLSVFADEKISLGKWLINGGIRADYFNFRYINKLNNNEVLSTAKQVISPKLGIYYNPTNKLQIFAKGGKGFHSNDTRVLLQNNVDEILPVSYGADLGFAYKPINSLYVQVAAWYLYMQQELVYVGDEGFVEPGGKTKRTGIDVSARFQPKKWLSADVDINIAKPRSLENPKGENYIPLAPLLTSTGGFTFQQKKFNASLRYRYIGNRPANEDNSIAAKGYTVTDAVFAYKLKNTDFGLSIENLFNVEWNEAQFATESRLKNEPAPVNELHFTPGTPFFFKFSITRRF